MMQNYYQVRTTLKASATTTINLQSDFRVTKDLILQLSLLFFFDKEI